MAKHKSKNHFSKVHGDPMQTLAETLNRIYGCIILKQIQGCSEIYYKMHQRILVCRKVGSTFTYAYLPAGSERPILRDKTATQFSELYSLTNPFLRRYLEANPAERSVKHHIIDEMAKSLQIPAQIKASKVKPAPVQRRHKEYKPLQKENLLHALGYDVSQKKKLSTYERQSILKEIIVLKQRMTKKEVINHIEWNIKMQHHDPRMKLAISKWEDDLKYIKKYL